jgi:hypothetical protein
MITVFCDVTPYSLVCLWSIQYKILASRSDSKEEAKYTLEEAGTEWCLAYNSNLKMEAVSSARLHSVMFQKTVVFRDVVSRSLAPTYVQGVAFRSSGFR